MSNLSQNWTCPTTRCLSCLRSWVTASNFSVWTWVTIPSSTCQMWSSGCRRWRQFSSTTTTSWVCEFLYLSTYWFIDLFFCSVIIWSKDSCSLRIRFIYDLFGLIVFGLPMFWSVVSFNCHPCVYRSWSWGGAEGKDLGGTGRPREPPDDKESRWPGQDHKCEGHPYAQRTRRVGGGPWRLNTHYLTAVFKALDLSFVIV